MSVDLHVDNFDVCPTLVNGRMAFGFEPQEEIERFLAFCVANPDHVYHGDGMRYPCSLLVSRYISEGRVSSLTADDLDDALRRFGWLRDDGDGERMHTTRPV